MAPITNQRLHARQLDRATTFSVAFGVLAGCIVLAACFWACIWPQLRVKFINPRFPARTRFRDEYELTRSLKDRLLRRNKRPPEFPSHPVVLHRYVRLRPPVGLQTYRPRNETSFISDSDMETTVGWPNERYCTPIASDCVGDQRSRALSAPWNNCWTANSGWPANAIPKDPVLSEVEEGFVQTRPKTLLSERAFGDAREYILAVPEPLFLRNTPSKAITRRSRSSSALPILETYCSDNTPQSDHRLRVNNRRIGHDGTISQQDLGDDETETQLSYVSEVSTFGGTEKSKDEICSTAESARDVASVADVSVTASDTDGAWLKEHNKSIAALNRLKTYRSLTGAKPVRPLSRAGTLTRPKTPVAEIRNRYDRSASASTPPSTLGSNINTSSAMLTLATDSSVQQLSTAHTSVEAMPIILGQKSSLHQLQTFPSFEEVIKTADEASCATKAHLLQKDSSARLETRHTAARPCPTFAANKTHQPRHRPSPLISASYIPVAKYQSKIIKPVSLVTSILTPPARKRGGCRSSFHGHDARSMGPVHDPASLSVSNVSGRTSVPAQTGSKLDATVDDELEGAIHGKGMKPLSPIVETGDGICLSDASFIEEKRELSRFSNPVHGSPDIVVTSKSPRDTTTCDDCSVSSAISTDMNSVDADATRISIPRVCVRESSVSIIGQLEPKGFEPPTREPSFGKVSSNSAFAVVTRGYAPGGACWL